MYANHTSFFVEGFEKALMSLRPEYNVKVIIRP